MTSRGKTQQAPRDNVVFEFGYAMAKLGRERVFHLVPKGRNVQVRILSDLAGMKPWEYELPDDFPTSVADLAPKATRLSRATKKRLRAVLSKALEAPSTFIGDSVRRLGPRTRLDLGVLEGPKFVTDVYADIAREFRAEGPNEVVNIALDMEQTWPAIRDRFLLPARSPEVRWRSLVLDPRSATLKKLEGPAFSTSIAAAMVDNMATVWREDGARLAKGPVQFECRAYDALPGVHGFVVNDDVAYVSLCGLSRDWSAGTGSPYLRFKRDTGIVAADHMIASVRALFDFHWLRSRPVWPPPPRSRRT